MSGEPDQTRWRGVQPVDGIRGVWPARNATRVYKFENLTGSDTVVIYTVPANMKLFIAGGFLASRLSGDAECRSYLIMRDDGDTTICHIIYHIYDIAGHQNTPLFLQPALEADAGDYILMGNSHANLDCRAGFVGWLEDA